MRAVDNSVGDAADSFDPGGKQGTWLHVDPRIAADPDTIRRTRQDDVARPQRHVTGREGDKFWNAEHHVRRGAMLHDMPIHDGLQLQIRSGNSIGRYDEGTDGAALVHILSECPLPRAQRCGLKLRRATADIVRDGVTEYVFRSRLFIGIDGRGAHDGGQLDFPVETVRFGDRDRDVRSINDKLGCPSREQVWERWRREFRFDAVLDVVDGCANNLRVARYWRCERQVGERDFALCQFRGPLPPARQILVKRINGSEWRDRVVDHDPHHAVLWIAAAGLDIANKTHASYSGSLFRRRKREIDLGGIGVGPTSRDGLGSRVKGNRTRTEQLRLGEGTVLPAGEVMKKYRKRNRHIDADLTSLNLVHKTAGKSPIVGKDRRPIAERAPRDNRNGLLVTGGTDNRQHRAEEFVGMHGHARAHVVQQARANKPSRPFRHDAAAVSHD